MRRCGRGERRFLRLAAAYACRSCRSTGCDVANEYICGRVTPRQVHRRRRSSVVELHVGAAAGHPCPARPDLGRPSRFRRHRAGDQGPAPGPRQRHQPDLPPSNSGSGAASLTKPRPAAARAGGTYAFVMTAFDRLVSLDSSLERSSKDVIAAVGVNATRRSRSGSKMWRRERIAGIVPAACPDA